MENKQENCAFPDNGNEVLTMAFVNIQPFDSVYSLSEGFRAGTIFPDMNKPFLAGRDAR